MQQFWFIDSIVSSVWPEFLIHPDKAAYFLPSCLCLDLVEDPNVE